MKLNTLIKAGILVGLMCGTTNANAVNCQSIGFEFPDDKMDFKIHVDYVPCYPFVKSPHLLGYPGGGPLEVESSKPSTLTITPIYGDGEKSDQPLTVDVALLIPPKVIRCWGNGDTGRHCRAGDQTVNFNKRLNAH